MSNTDNITVAGDMETHSATSNHSNVKGMVVNAAIAPHSAISSRIRVGRDAAGAVTQDLHIFKDAKKTR